MLVSEQITSRRKVRALTICNGGWLVFSVDSLSVYFFFF